MSQSQTSVGEAACENIWYQVRVDSIRLHSNYREEPRANKSPKYKEWIIVAWEEWGVSVSSEGQGSSSFSDVDVPRGNLETWGTEIGSSDMY